MEKKNNGELEKASEKGEGKERGAHKANKHTSQNQNFAF